MVGYAIPLATHGGRGMPVFAGERRQMGGSLFATIKRIAIPLLQKLLPSLKTLGKRAVGSALNVGTGLASDLISGQIKKIPENLRKRSKAEVNSLSRDYLGQEVFKPSEGQEGSGSKSRKRRRLTAGGVMKMKAINKRNASHRRQAIESDIFS